MVYYSISYEDTHTYSNRYRDGKLGSRSKEPSYKGSEALTRERKRRAFRIMMISGLVFCSFMFGTYFNVFANTNDSDMQGFQMTQLHTGSDIVNARDTVDGSHLVNAKKTVDVKPGDTLWKIAAEHSPNNVDTRFYVEQIKELNSLNGHLIYADQLLYLP